MVSLNTIRESNAQCKSLHNLVAVFVGGTGGIGENTVKEFFARTTRPRAYIVGRNASHATAIQTELHSLNPEGTSTFLPCDTSLIANVDALCTTLLAHEPKIHCLLLTAGFMSLAGRTPTVEGLDAKMSVNYYTRMRIIQLLQPALTAAAAAGELSRVISVLGAGSEDDIHTDDLDLQHRYSLHACLAHCVVFTDFMVEEFAARHPETSFSHSFPGSVKTGITKGLSGPTRLAVKVMYAVMASWVINVSESGERHFFQLTSRCYPARQGAAAGVEIPQGLGVMRGVDGREGSGAYLLEWDGGMAGDQEKLGKYREMNFGPVVWRHTMEMFAQALRRMAKEGKRVADEEAEGAGREIPDPVGWRAGS